MAKSVTLIICLLSCSLIYGQQQQIDLSVQKIPFKNPVNNFDTIYSWNCLIILPDIDTKFIHLKMGYELNDSSLINHSFLKDFDVFLPAGLAYERDSNQVVIGLGNRRDTIYHISITLEDDSSNLSQVYNWSNNL